MDDIKKDHVWYAAKRMVSACELYYFTNRSCQGCPLNMNSPGKGEISCKANIPMTYDVRLTHAWEGGRGCLK